MIKQSKFLKEHFHAELLAQCATGAAQGLKAIRIDCRLLYFAVKQDRHTGHPDMRFCIDAMRSEQRPEDEVKAASPYDRGASLIILYRVPR